MITPTLPPHFMRPRRRALALALAAMTSISLGSSAIAQALPEGTIVLVVPTTPGSTPDILARTIAPQLTKRWERTVVVDNRTGASGNIGTEHVVRAAPTGNTLLVAASTLATGSTLQKSIPFDARRDLTPIVQLGWTQMALVTPPSRGWANVQDLIAAARKAPGRLVYSSPGNGTPNHLTAELFKVQSGTFITHVPYRGSGPQLNDVLGGHVDMAVITATAASPHVKAGKLVALAVAGNNRSPMLPNVPSLTESGVPGVLGDIWYGVFGPKGMAPELVARLNTDFREAMRLEEKKFNANGIVVETGTPQAFGKLLAEDTERWAELIKRQGIKGDL